MKRTPRFAILSAVLLATVVSGGPTMTAMAADTPVPLAIRVQTESLGRSAQGTVVGILIEVAPEDVERLDDRMRVVTSLLDGQRLVDRYQTVVEPQPDGSIMLYREMDPGSYQLRVAIAAMEDEVGGVWFGDIEVTRPENSFAAPEGATPDAVALELMPPAEGSVRFLPPPDLGGIGAAQLEVSVPEATRSVEFSRDDQVLLTKNRPPWIVSVPLGEVISRTSVRAVAYDARGRYLGEDSLILNNPTGQVGVEILLAPESTIREGERTVTVSVTSSEEIQQVSFAIDDETVARWGRCPCVISIDAERLRQATILTADATDAEGHTGDAVLIPGVGGGFVGTVQVELVELPVVVLDRADKPVLGLEKEDFTALEDGVEVELEGFGTTADLPLSLALAVDTSGSMHEIFPQVREAVEGFADGLLEPGDEVLLVRFAWDATVELEWTDEVEDLPAQLARVTPEGGTSLHDAMVRSLEQFRGRRGRQALVLLTDGEDTTSRTDWKIALRYAHTMRIPIFPIGLGVGKLDFAARSALKDMAEETGGDVFFPKKVEELPAVYARIAELLRSQYLLWYRSPSEKAPEKFREIEVRVARDGVEPRTIRGYYPGK